MGIHEGHRDTLRKNFLSTGLEGRSDHQILELLLTYALPRIDVNPIAHELIDRFGSLAGVMDASAEDLQQVRYISENGAVLLKLIPELITAYNRSKWSEKPRLATPSEVMEYLAPFFTGRREETVFLLTLDSRLQCSGVFRIATGSDRHSGIDVRDVLNAVLRTNAAQAVLAHNHPSGSAVPSKADMLTTKTVYGILADLDIVLVDHMIFAGDKTYSFANEGLMEKLVNGEMEL